MLSFRIRLQAAVSLFFIGCALVVPAGCVLFPFLGWKGVLGAAIVVILGLAALALASERLLIRLHRGRPPGERGLSGTYTTVLAEILEESFSRGAPNRYSALFPELLVFESASPVAWAGRGFWGSGTVCLSTGCLEQLSESELQALLRRSVFLCRDGDLPLRTFFCAVSVVFWLATPPAWRSLLVPQAPAPVSVRSCTARSALRALFVFPFLRVSLHCAMDAGRRSDGVDGDPALEAAALKISRGLALHRPRGPGFAGGLYVP